jgi:hypothetical protein
MADSMPLSENSLLPITLLRDHLLPDLLQDDQREILYWAGKALSRDYSLNGIADIEAFFATASFGDITMTSQKATSQTWKLTGPIVEGRLAESKDASFDLEAGFLAQQTEAQVGVRAAEAQYSVGRNSVTFSVLTEEEDHMLD